MRVLRERTSWETSLMILALSLGESVVNHFARRCCGEILLTLALNEKVGDEVLYLPLYPGGIGG